MRGEIAELAQRRLEAGDISELETNASRVEALQAEADAEQFRQEVVLAQNRLRNLNRAFTAFQSDGRDCRFTKGSA